jgi:hypothetical protein
MTIDSNIPAQKKVVSVDILHLDELGYGPQGKHTRREWRAECLENLLAGGDTFKQWQDSWKDQISNHLSNVSFAAKLIYDDGSQLDILNKYYENFSSYTLDFVGSKFSTTLLAKHLEFKQFVLFTGSTFVKYSNFKNAIFYSYANFSNTIFCSKASFEAASFNENADFRLANFYEDADFNSVIFIGDAYFISAEFNQSAEFTNSTFNRVSFIVGVVFGGGVYFSKVKFLNLMCFFQGSIFKSNSSFENAVFDNVGHFEDVRFMTHSPSFRGCKIDSTRLEFSDDSYFPANDSNPDAIKNISFLKRLADEHGQTDQALNFNAMELRAKRLLPNAGWGFKTITWLYEVVSDFGRSYLRPLMIYALLIWLSFLYSFGYSDNTAENAKINSHLCANDPNKLNLSRDRAAFEYAIFRAGGLMDFTDNGKQNNAVNCRLFEEPIEPPLMRAWGIFKGIASIALLFLAALGLRNKYRIK